MKCNKPITPQNLRSHQRHDLGGVWPSQATACSAHSGALKGSNVNSVASNSAPGDGRPPLGYYRQRAFTLIELLLVLVILGVLAAIVVPKFSGRTEQARQTAAQSQISTFGTALDAFEVDNGYYPKGKSGLLDLVQPPRDAQTWRGPYLKGDVPNDPWGNPYIYECPGKHNPTSYDIMSMGPDGRVGGDDDISNWTQKR